MKAETDLFEALLTRIGENVKKKRKERNLSLEKLGLEIGLTRMQVHRIENGYNITIKTLLKLSLALNTKMEELIKFEQKFKKDDLEKLLNSNKLNKKQTKKAN